jgi:hypothetical protein
LGSAHAEYHHVAGCEVCHDFHAFGKPNLYIIAEVIQTPNSGPKPVVFTARTGPNSFADGDAVYDGVCEVCHTQNGHHNNDGHDNTEHFDGEQCTRCHGHNKEFAAPYARAHKTHLTADKGPHLACSDCHGDPMQLQPTLFADGLAFAETGVCDSCHSPDGDYDGVNDAQIGAKSNWADGVYDDNSNLNPGKEMWCVGCHDGTPSSIGGVLAPNIAGDESAVTLYGAGWGFYRSGHGLPGDQNYPASGAKGAGKGCLDCHDAAKGHIDGEPRTYSADGSYTLWDPASNGYQEGYRLKDVAGGYGGRYPMHIPRTGHVFPPGFRESAEFALCFECHDENKLYNGGDPLTGEGAGTNFRTNMFGYWISMHDVHTDGRNGPWGPTTPQYDSDYDGVADSRISCPACHNVHGSPSPVMMRHGELISTMGTGDKVPSLNFQYTPEGTYPLLGDSTGGKIGTIGGMGSLYKNGVCNMCHSDRVVYSRSPVTGTPPDTPLNLSPAANESNVSLAPLLTASDFIDPDPSNTQRASQWQISATPGDYSAPVYDSGSSSDLGSHQADVWLETGTTYYWRVRYQNVAGSWSAYSQETSFTTLAGGAPTTLTITPSGLVDNSGGFSVTEGSTWADALDVDDGDASYAYLCCADYYMSFTVGMDDPAELQGAVITSVTVHVAARAKTSSLQYASPYKAWYGVNIGYQTGTSVQWSGGQTLDTSGNYVYRSTQTFTTDSDGGPLDVDDIYNLQVTVRRDLRGNSQLMITRIWAEVEYIPVY